MHFRRTLWSFLFKEKVNESNFHSGSIFGGVQVYSERKENAILSMLRRMDEWMNVWLTEHIFILWLFCPMLTQSQDNSRERSAFLTPLFSQSTNSRRSIVHYFLSLDSLPSFSQTLASYRNCMSPASLLYVNWGARHRIWVAIVPKRVSHLPSSLSLSFGDGYSSTSDFFKSEPPATSSEAVRAETWKVQMYVKCSILWRILWSEWVSDWLVVWVRTKLTRSGCIGKFSTFKLKTKDCF